MESRLQRVRLADLDWEDQRFAIRSFVGADHLRDSIERRGILLPPWLLQTGEQRYAIVDGCKRLTALRELSADACDCLVFAESSDCDQLLLRRVEAKLFGAVLNPAEKAQIIAKLARVLPEEQILTEYFPALQIPARPDALRRWTRLAAQDEGFLETAAAERICERAALELAGWEAEERGLAAALLGRLRCSASIQLEIIEQISEIALAQGRKRLDILGSPEFREILEDPRLNHRQKTEGLRELLRRRRFPRLRARQQRFREDLARCHLPPRVRVQHPPAFEGTEWQLQVTFSSPEELRELLGVAGRLAGSHQLGDLLSPGSGGSEGDSLENPPHPPLQKGGEGMTPRRRAESTGNEAESAGGELDEAARHTGVDAEPLHTAAERLTKDLQSRAPRKLLIEAEVLDTPLVKALRKTLPAASLQVVEQVPEAASFEPALLEIVRFKGRFLKDCPGTRHYLCCGYQILHFGVQCTLQCSYCILQAYLNQPNLRLFGNTDDLFRELDAKLEAQPDRLHRIGTGEFTDSLLLDPWTQFSRRLVPHFSGRPNAVLELKTKTAHIENLADLDHGGHTIVSWSLNAEPVRRREEARAATIRQRLHAARQCAAWGYRLSFHFDPLVHYPGWEKDYGEVLTRLFDAVDPGRIVWISLGAFRFMPELKGILRRKHPESRILYGEFIRGPDGKMRYFRDLRVELYAFMVERIRRADPDLRVYLCMEGEDIWREAFGFSPEQQGGLSAMLDRAVRERMQVGER